MADHDKLEEDREIYSELIINSPDRKKIIVSGPGTGKTYTFKELLKRKGGKALALTFINNLVGELKKDLEGLAETKTFHAFCVKLLHENPFLGINHGFNIYPKLPEVINSDERIITGGSSNFDEAFQCLIETDGRIDFFIKRANFYNTVGFFDSVYRTLKYFQQSTKNLPLYDQVLIDEYQDFNILEVTFIDELAKVNPILIVGDDDQAIYPFFFRYASPYFIRAKAADPNYTRFELPYCSRCTLVLIDAVNDIITHAKIKGNLGDRVDKKFFCYLPEKRTDCLKYPKIVHAQCTVQTKRNQFISLFIEKEIQKIGVDEIKKAKEGGYPCVLIIGPPNYFPNTYLNQIYDYLISRGYKVDYKKKRDGHLKIIDGYLFLLEDILSNIGWRIILESDRIIDMDDIIKQTDIDSIAIAKRLPKEYIGKHMEIIEILKLFKENKASKEEQQILKDILDLDLSEIKDKLGLEECVENSTVESEPQRETIQPDIKITNFLGAKGLSGGFVFIVGLNNGTMPVRENSPTDNEICNFIVALTRARNRCYLLSNQQINTVRDLEPSIFIDWIDSSRLSKIRVDAMYFR